MGSPPVQSSESGAGNPTTGALRVRTLRPQTVAADRAFQLWVLPENQKRVRPVGLLPTSGDRVLELPLELLTILANAQKFGVSVEAPEGSPTGQPTTTPLYHGKPMTL